LPPQEANPVPWKSTKVPAGPDDRFITSCGRTVKTVVAAPESWSVPVKRCPPYVVDAIENPQLKLPVPLVVAVHAVPPLQVTVTGTPVA